MGNHREENHREEIIHSFIFEELYNSDFSVFKIPLYQRKYAWSSGEVETLLNDLLTFKEKKSEKEKYFIGNIVVEENNGSFDIIDGQQRFTTIYLMSKLLGHNYFELDYAIRKRDSDFLKNFGIKNKDDITKEVEKYQADEQFILNINAIFDFFNEKKIDIHDKQNGLKGLLELCKITLTILPKGIDIVKYFEVMNNRGKQLEKHQILKAKFIERIGDSKNVNYAKIWDYCSNMNVYLDEQINYKDQDKDEKNIEIIRDSFNNFLLKALVPEYFKGEQDQEDKKTILQMISDNDNKEKHEDYYERKSYTSIIKFPIFIIQVFKVFITQNANKYDLDKVVVNERYLLDYFLDNGELKFNKNEAEEFILFLFKMRILFDKYIFKRDEDQKPDFKYRPIENVPNNILNLQLLFSYTSPQRITQDWVSVALKWLNNNVQNVDENYEAFLMSFDKAFAKTRLDDNIKLIDQVNYYLENEDYKYSEKINNDLCKFEKINNGTNTPHYWFYKLDYLLWRDYKWTQDFSNKFTQDEKFNYQDIRSKFRLSQLNSIEHIQPQSKSDKWKDKELECCHAERKIDCFGNLALISNHMNSSLSNESENKKERIQMQLNMGTIESLKMLLVYSEMKSSDDWTIEKSKQHHEEMLKILKRSLV